MHLMLCAFRYTTTISIAMALSGVCLHVVRRKVPHNMILPNDLKLLEK